MLAQPLFALAWVALAQGPAIKARSTAGLPMRSGWHTVMIVVAVWLLIARAYVALVGCVHRVLHYRLSRLNPAVPG